MELYTDPYLISQHHTSMLLFLSALYIHRRTPQVVLATRTTYLWNAFLGDLHPCIPIYLYIYLPEVAFNDLQCKPCVQ